MQFELKSIFVLVTGLALAVSAVRASQQIGAFLLVVTVIIFLLTVHTAEPWARFWLNTTICAMVVFLTLILTGEIYPAATPFLLTYPTILFICAGVYLRPTLGEFVVTFCTVQILMFLHWRAGLPRTEPHEMYLYLCGACGFLPLWMGTVARRRFDALMAH